MSARILILNWKKVLSETLLAKSRDRTHVQKSMNTAISHCDCGGRECTEDTVVERLFELMLCNSKYSLTDLCSKLGVVVEQRGVRLLVDVWRDSE